MIVYPAIDLRGGRCVRLTQGDFGRETVFADDPVWAAERWAGEGAEWLHVVNLDGALGTTAEANLDALRRIRRAVDVPIQFGGGLRSADDVGLALEMGVSRAILGTVAVREPQVVAEALARHGPERVSVGIDARGGRVAVQGWTDVSDLSAVELGRRMAELGVTRVVYTDIARDGTLSGPDVEGTARLARATGLSVIASGGVSSYDDLRRLREGAREGIEGAVIGMALYRGAVSLREAIELLKGY